MRKSVLWFVILSALALLPAAAQAAAPRTVASCDGARVDKAAGVARTLSDCGRVDLARGAEGAARQALGRFAGALGVRRDTRDLRVMRVFPTAAGPRVRFQQFVKGIPVRNGQVAVALAKDGSVSHVANSAVAATALDTKARVSRAEALLTARRRVPSGFDLVSAPTTTLVAEPTAGGGLALAWLVVLPTRAPRGDWNVVVSARRGDVLKAYDAIRHVDGSGLTNAPNPVQQTGNTGLRDNADSNQAILNSARVRVPLTDLSAGSNRLVGTYTDTTLSDPLDCDLPYSPGQASSASRTYDFNRSQDPFEEVVAYAAITRVQHSYIDFGFPGIFDHPLAIDVHCTSDDNSFYSPGDGRLHMGDGGVDDAEDADVTVHEFGHATQDAQVPGFGPGPGDTEQGAMGEGFGDFLATYTYLQDGNAAYQAGHRFCAMEWDATSYNPVVAGNSGSGCLRWTDGRNENDGTDIGTFPGAPTEVHDDGRYWSAMLTCVFNGIEPSLGTAQARNRMLTLVIAHHFDLVPDASNNAFADSLDALRQEDKARFDGNEIALINGCGQQRLGVVPPDPTPPVVDGALTPALPDGANGWYRTVPTVHWSFSDPQGDLLLKHCLDTVLAPDTPGTTLTCTAISDGGATSRSLTYKKDQSAPSLLPALSRSAPSVGQRITATPNAADTTSGVAAQSCGTPSTVTKGKHSVTCSATDVAGNGATRTLSYVVRPRPLPTLRVSKVKVASNGTVSFRLKAGRAVKVSIGAKAGKVRFRSTSENLKRLRTKTITLKLSTKARTAFLRKLRGGKRVKVTVTVSTAQGAKRTLILKVRRR
ncbi:MAG: hypothetical protein QOC68_1970 [Solirubrobacteraceae bacterium]|nr:hypothetical protein [Solirubrobacteraceae bacterium]